MKKQKGKWRIFTTSAALVCARAHAHVCMWDKRVHHLCMCTCIYRKIKELIEGKSKKQTPKN